MSPAPSVVRDEHAGRLEAVRLGVRYAAAPPERSEHGEAGPLTLAEGRLAAGRQRLGPFEVALAADHAGERAEWVATLRNADAEARYLESVVLGFRWQGADLSALRYLKNGWQSWSFTGSRALDAEGEPDFGSGPWLRGLHHPLSAPPADRAGWHESSLVSVARDGVGRTCLAGVLEGGLGTGLVYWQASTGGLRVEVEIQLEVPLEPGASLEVEPVQVALGRDENALLESFADDLGRASGARTGAALPTGWCSWYQFFHDVTEQDLLRNLEALSRIRSEFPVAVVQLDDGYQRAIGDWLETNRRFPRGLAPVADEIRAAGFRPGLWTAPFCAVGESRVAREHPEWLLGSYRSAGGPHRGLLHPAWTGEGWVYSLDPTRDEVIAHLDETFASLVGMGFSYLKLDFLYVAAMQARAGDPSYSKAGRLRRGLDAIRRGAGEEAFLLGCGCPLGPAVGVVDAMRIGPDVAPHWAPAPGSPPGLEETLPSTRSALRSVLARVWMHRRLWINDPDCLMARTRGTELREPEVDALADAIAVTGGLTMISDDLPQLVEADRVRVRRTVERAREIDAAGMRGVARAVGLLDREIPSGIEARTASACWRYTLNADEAPRGALAAHAASLDFEPRDLRLAVFCDYDGTFAIQDVGSSLAKAHAGERREALWDRLGAGEFTAWQYNMELLDGLELPEEKLEAFLRTVEPTPGAHELVRWCEDHGVPFRILSDGFGRNLDRLQELHGVRFAYDANHLWYEKGRWRLAPGSPDPSCSCGTGTCKRARIAAFRALHPKATVIHIGNGRVSDLCASQSADLVFAKDTLAEELDRRGIAYQPFATLHDVLAQLPDHL
jgi:alpha-galactosidase